MKFKFLLTLIAFVFSAPLFSQVDCKDLLVNKIICDANDSNRVSIELTNLDTNMSWSPYIIALLDPVTNDTLVTRSLCGCVTLLYGSTSEFVINTQRIPFVLSPNFTCTVILTTQIIVDSTTSYFVTCKKTYNAKSGITPLVNKGKINLFPNPAINNLAVDVSESSNNNRIAIVNTQGQFVFSETVTGKRANLDVSNLAKGIYFVQLYSNGKLTATNKLVVQ